MVTAILEITQDALHVIAARGQTYYSILIKERSGDQKKLFQTTGKLMHTKNENKLPSHASLKELTNRFAECLMTTSQKLGVT